METISLLLDSDSAATPCLLMSIQRSPSDSDVEALDNATSQSLRHRLSQHWRTFRSLGQLPLVIAEPRLAVTGTPTPQPYTQRPPPARLSPCPRAYVLNRLTPGKCCRPAPSPLVPPSPTRAALDRTARLSSA